MPQLSSYTKATQPSAQTAQDGKATLGMHYHIRWSTKDTIDWERFETHSTAEERARQLVRPTENYTIEQQGEACHRCANISGTGSSSL